MPFDKRTVQAGGCQIEYAELGNGPNVVLLHGSGGFRFDETAFGLLARDHRVLVPSMPGFDQSTIGGVNSGSDTADVMAQFISAAAGGSAHVVGESFGGRIAAWLAIRHPNVVQTVILAAPGGLRRGDGAERRLDGTPQEQQIRLFGKPLDPPPTAAQDAQRRANLATAIRLSGPSWDEQLYQQLPTVHVPALVLYGTNDQTLTREAIELFHERIPGSRISFLDGAPHVISAAYPEQFASLVSDFIKAGAPA